MASSLDKLVQIGSPALAPPEPEFALNHPQGSPARELLQLLRTKNGFYAFESALHVFPTRSNDAEIGLVEWNAPRLWIDDYRGMADGCLFFAEDVFGGQFCINPDGIHSFDPETGALQHMAADLEGWADAILGDYDVLTGYPLCHEWQQIHGRLAPGVRLLPKTPFVAGGEFALDNLYALDAVKGMRFRAAIAVQIKDLPDGSSISLKVAG